MWIEILPEKHQAKALWEISLLEEYGLSIKMPYVKNIKGEEYKGPMELRVKQRSDISRIFYFLPVGHAFILLHGFVKNTRRLPKRS